MSDKYFKKIFNKFFNGQIGNPAKDGGRGGLPRDNCNPATGK